MNTIRSLDLKHTEMLAAINQPLLQWYRQQARILPWRESPTPYRVWISEIMLQQTRVEAVKPFFERFLQALPDIAALAEVEENVLLKLWEGLGYYNRARNLQKAARLLRQEYAGQLPEEFDLLLKLPGIGRYTAGAISSIAYGKRCPAVDGNVLRVVTRLIACPLDILKDSTKHCIENALQESMPPAIDSRDFNQALMELGAMVCLPKNPHCGQCPLQNLCLAFSERCIEAFPVKKPAKARRIEKKTILLLKCKDSIALHQRPATGLLASLWELPNLSGHIQKDELQCLLANHGWRQAGIHALPACRHVFSHIEWQMIGWEIECVPGNTIQEENIPYAAAKETQLPWSQLRFVTLKEACNQYSIPTAFQYYLSKACRISMPGRRISCK